MDDVVADVRDVMRVLCCDAATIAFLRCDAPGCRISGTSGRHVTDDELIDRAEAVNNRIGRTGRLRCASDQATAPTLAERIEA